MLQHNTSFAPPLLYLHPLLFYIAYTQLDKVLTPGVTMFVFLHENTISTANRIYDVHMHIDKDEKSPICTAN